MSQLTLDLLRRKISDNKKVHETTHPMDRLALLQTFAERDSDTNTATLINTLLTIIDGLHTRLCNVEEAQVQAQAPPTPTLTADMAAEIAAGIAEATALHQ
jgi:hypothetical protein